MGAPLYDPARHEPLCVLAWDEGQARSAIERIVQDAESRYSEYRYWPLHPQDRQGDDDAGRVEISLYNGACGVMGLNYLQSVGAARLSRSYIHALDRLLAQNATRQATPCRERPSWWATRPST
jgi:hypothetical protein